MMAHDGDQSASSRVGADALGWGVSGWSATYRDPDEQAECISSVYSQVYDQLSCGPFIGEIATVDLGGMLVLRERVNRRLLQTGLINALTVSWVWKKSSRYCSNGIEHDDDCLMFHGAGEEFDILCGPSEMVAVSISEQTLADWFGCPTASMDPGLFRGPKKIRADMTVSFRRAILAALSVADRESSTMPGSRWRDSLRDELLQMVTAVAELPGLGDRRTRRRERTYARVVRAARDYALQNAAEAGLPDVCEHIGVSRRNLHYAFASVMGVSPGQYLHYLRLNAARRDIKRRGRAAFGVADIASRWGFWHPSHFAANYKRRFGELPSETAHRAASAGKPARFIPSICI